MQESFLEGKPKENDQIFFGIGAHILMWLDENDLSGRSLVLHDFHKWQHQDGVGPLSKTKIKSFGNI